jgi:hypothetical protein
VRLQPPPPITNAFEDISDRFGAIPAAADVTPLEADLQATHCRGDYNCSRMESEHRPSPRIAPEETLFSAVRIPVCPENAQYFR